MPCHRYEGYVCTQTASGVECPCPVEAGQVSPSHTLFTGNGDTGQTQHVVTNAGRSLSRSTTTEGASVARYRKKPVVIEAHQWHRNGDHPEDGPADCEGEVVRYFRHPGFPGDEMHVCGVTWHDHGWIDTLEGGHTVCPGDFIITGVQGERYPCKPDIFDETYEPVDV